MKCLARVVVVLSWLLGTVVHAAEAQPPANPIKIGAIFGVTGPAANLGGPEEKTARMVVDQINAAGGINGLKVELIVKDSGGSPEKAVSFAKQLIEEDKVLAIIGPSTSGETLQIKPICEAEKMILISCAAAETIVKPVAKYVFKTPQTDSQAATLIYNTMKEKKISKIGVLSDNTGFGKAGKEQLEKLAPEHGIQIVAQEVFDKEATDLTDILAKVKAAGVEAVVNWSVVPAQSIVPKNMKQMGFDVPLFQSHGFGNLKYVAAAGKAAEGIVFPAGRLLVADVLPKDHVQKTVLETYKKDYEKQFKEDVSTFGGHAYDAIMILKAAIEKAGSTDTEKVRDAIENLKGFVGTAGVFNFSPEDHCGLSLDAFEMLTVKNGKFALYEK
jgi:branched-chain amino acid transport system substrate-binding protein